MFKQDLKMKYLFLVEYFERGLKNPKRAIAHSILLHGHDIISQYALAKEIARILNCSEDKSEDCHCLNCSWVRNNQHPAVLTVSKIDSKPLDDDSKTVISVKQSHMIKNFLLNTSDYHRVFIFCDAKIDDGIWIPMGLNETNFHAETANSLLKIIEEPPTNTTFFFLTRDKSDLIETIISRSQSFFVPFFETENNDYSIIGKIFEDYLKFERKDSLDLAQKLFLLSKEHGSERILTEIQNFMLDLLKYNLDNSRVKNKILLDIKLVELTKHHIEGHINPQLALEDMCLNLIKG